MTDDMMTSVWEGNDADWLRRAIPFYWRGEGQPKILDVTWGSGRWWEGWPNVIGLDRFVPASIKGDFCRLPFQDGVFDVVVFDPPHRSAGGPNRSRLLEDRFGSIGYRPDALIPQLYPALSEARRVLRTRGIVLAKLTDQVHWHRMVWHQVKAVDAAWSVGLVPCDMVVKVRSHGIVSSKWINSYHALKRHAFWLVFRLGAWKARPGGGPFTLTGRCEP